MKVNTAEHSPWQGEGAWDLESSGPPQPYNLFGN